MSPFRTTIPLSRCLVQLAFALVLLALIGRVAQLARLPTPGDVAIRPASAVTLADQKADHELDLEDGSLRRAPNGSTAGGPSGPSAAAELAALYAHCPMAAVVDLPTAAAAPESHDALLPPYRPAVAREPAPPREPAIPRIRYPVSVRPQGAASAGHEARGGELRIAAVPSNGPVAANATSGDWLIDPSEWYLPGDGSRPAAAEPATSAPPATTPGAHIDADPSEPPPATHAPGGSPPPVDDEFGPPAAVQPSTASQQTDDIFAPPRVLRHEPLPPPPGAKGVFAPPPVPSTPSAPLPAPVAGSEKHVDPHLALFAKNNYPSARECAACHEDIYHEWSISAHAYAAVSPMFQKFEQKLNDLSQGTVGYFCVRCHAPVATALCQSRAEPLWNMPEVAREGITCIVCHRVQYIYGKSNGERRIEPGDMFAPVFGGIGGQGVAEVLAHKDQYKVKASPDVAGPGGSGQDGRAMWGAGQDGRAMWGTGQDGRAMSGPGQDMHLAGIYFETLTRSEFCTPCHQVAVYPGIKLEVVWEQYRASPACKKGIQCQDCHMGRVPGLPLGYNCGPVAKVNGQTVNDHRKKSNHIFYGPNYSIAHPGIFPFHLRANRWTMDEWLLFDWRAGWGKEEFEDRVSAGQIKPDFPPVWAEADDRYDAREIIDDNLAKLRRKRELRVEVMENGSHVEGPFFDTPPGRGADLHLHYLISNTNEGHNLLTASLGAQPQLWANIVLIGPDGRRLWETGYTDSFGDVCNIHSHDVRHRKVPFDWQLFNLQTMFLITGAKGTDREFYVPVNVDIDQLPFIRPGVQPITVLNHPPFIRMESQSLAPLGSRRVPYRIPGHLLEQPGTYRLSFRLRSRAEPIYFMQFCGATEEMQRSMNEWMIDIHPSSVEFTIP